jgi:putative transferase (TIGR04331 family)
MTQTVLNTTDTTEVPKDLGLSAMSKERYELSDKLLAILTPVMNEVHGTTYSHRFWSLVMAPYVNAVLSVQRLFEQQPITAKPGLFAVNTFRPLTAKQVIKANMVRYAKFCLGLKHLVKNKRVLKYEHNILIGFSGIEYIVKALGTPVCNTTFLFYGHGDTSKRKIVNSIACRYDDTFYRNLITQLPKLYVEFFTQAYNSIPLYNPAAKTIHLQMVTSETTEFLVAKYIEHGAKLYWYQHGACYGEYVGHNAHHNESNIADVFRSWGWKIKPNDEPWKAYRLQKFKDNYDSSITTKKHSLMLCYTIVYPANEKKMAALTDFFLTNISKEKYNSILARPRAINKLNSHSHLLHFIKDSRVTIDTGLTDMALLTRQCELVIQMMVPGTNFLECIYVNHPVMGILVNEQPTDMVKPYYDFFVNNGVLHYNFDTLIQHLNNIDIQQWWQHLIQQPMYLDFKNTFARQV